MTRNSADAFAISIAALQLAKVAGLANSMDSRSFIDLAADKFASGDVPSHAMRHLSNRFDEYIAKVLSTTTSANIHRTVCMPCSSASAGQRV